MLFSTNPEGLHHVLDFFSFTVAHCRFEGFLPIFLQVITMVAHSLELRLVTFEILILCVPEVFSSLFWTWSICLVFLFRSCFLSYQTFPLLFSSLCVITFLWATSFFKGDTQWLGNIHRIGRDTPGPASLLKQGRSRTYCTALHPNSSWISPVWVTPQPKQWLFKIILNYKSA